MTAVKASSPKVVPSDDELKHAADLLNDAKKITILAGAGAEGAHDQVIALADQLGAPIVHTLRSKQFIEYDNPFDVGMTGLLGFASGYRAMDQAAISAAHQCRFQTYGQLGRFRITYTFRLQ